MWFIVPHGGRIMQKNKYLFSLPIVSPSGSSSLNNSTQSNNMMEGLDSSESGSESDLDLHNLASNRGPLRFVYPRRHSPRRLRWGPIDQRRLGVSPHSGRLGSLFLFSLWSTLGLLNFFKLFRSQKLKSKKLNPTN